MVQRWGIRLQWRILGRCGFDPWVGKIPWRKAWQPTPVFLPGESHGQRNLAGYSPWGHKESGTTWNSLAHTQTTQGFLGGSVVKNLCLQCRRRGFEPWIRKIPWRSKWQLTPLSCLENHMDRGAGWAIVHVIAKESDTDLVTKQWQQNYPRKSQNNNIPYWVLSLCLALHKYNLMEF